MTESTAARKFPLQIAAGLAAILVAIFLLVKFPKVGRAHLIAADEKSAIEILRKVHETERHWRRDDADGNALPDYWTGDWSGFHRALGADGRPADRMAPEVAAADGAPLGPESGLGPPLAARPFKGYWFRAMEKADGARLAVDGPDSDGYARENLRAYAFVAWPAEHGVSGKRTFMVREDGTVWAREFDAGAAPPLEWPADPAGAGWAQAE